MSFSEAVKWADNRTNDSDSESEKENSNSKKISSNTLYLIIGLIILVVIVIALYFYFKSNSNSVPNPNPVINGSNQLPQINQHPPQLGVPYYGYPPYPPYDNGYYFPQSPKPEVFPIQNNSSMETSN